MTGLALHQEPLLGPQRRLRVAAAVIVLGAAIAGAVALYSHKFLALDCGQGIFCSRPDAIVVKPGWVGPTAGALCLFGVAAAVVLLTVRLRLATALVILGAALTVATVVYYDPRAQLISYTCLPNGGASCTPHLGYNGSKPGWVGPTALSIALLGIALAAGILLTARRTPSD